MTRYLMFKLTNFIVFLQFVTHYELDACKTFQKNWDWGMFTTVLQDLDKRLGTEDTNC